MKLVVMLSRLHYVFHIEAKVEINNERKKQAVEI